MQYTYHCDHVELKLTKTGRLVYEAELQICFVVNRNGLIKIKIRLTDKHMFAY